MAKDPKPNRAKAARPKARAATSATAAKPKAARKAAKSRGKPKANPRPAPKPEPGLSAADALAGLLESPLVADIIAAGAAAALSTITHRALSKKDNTGTSGMLKQAAKAAGAAIRERIEEEFDEVVKAAKERGSEAK